MSKSDAGVFKRRNYCLILISVLLLISGFLFMLGYDHPVAVSYDMEIYSFRRITLAPVTLLAGYVLMIYAIMSVKNITKTPRHG